ncbi:hypothetical protein [Actinoallomurus liliacearum]
MTTVIMVIVVAVVILAGVGIGLLARSRTGPQAPVPLVPTAVPAELQDRVQALLAEDRPVQAVKEVRQATGLRLVDAKRLVDTLRDGRLPEPGPHLPSQGSESLADRARRMRDGGDLSGAVALVQAETGMTRQDADRFVTSLG